MMSTVVPPQEAAPSCARAAGPDIEVVDDLRAVEALWRSLEADALMTPYGRYDWVAAHQAATGALPRTRVAIHRGAGGEALFLQPFELERRFGLSIARAIGGRHANYNLPVLRPHLANTLDAAAARSLLGRAGRALGADLVDIRNVPVVWGDWPNPFAAPGRPSADGAWALPLEADLASTIGRSMSADARKKLRSKTRGMEKLGAVKLLRAGDRAEVERLLDAYFAQKGRRFAELGIADPFADEAARAFLRQGASERIETAGAAIELYALELGGEIIAVLGGAVDRSRFSGMVLSFGSGPYDKFSPGEQLVVLAVEDLCRRGFATFDLGVGDARYKRAVCDRREALVDIVLPLTWRGRLAAASLRFAAGLKRRLKSSPRAMSALARARKALAALRDRRSH